MIKDFIKNSLFSLKKKKYNFAPVFIIGCGRSGTTILGKTLGKHKDIKYLNEIRDLWHNAYPEFDIWNGNITNSKLFANKTDINIKKNNLLQKLLFREQVLGNATILLEKLPINNFRLDFLNSSFPKAKYIYLTRNGLEVSASIEKRIKNKNWFTQNKYALLQKFYNKHYEIFNCNTFSDIEKGMWEWKMSIDQSDQFFKTLNSQAFIHLSYTDLTETPKSSIEKILKFLNLEYSNNNLNYMCKNIQRNTLILNKTKNNSLLKLGGKILSETIDNTYYPI